MQNINFLKEQLVVSRQKEKKRFFVKTWSLAALGLYGVIIFASFSYQLLLKRQNNVYKKQMEEKEKIIISLQPVEAKQLYLTSKIKSLAQLVASKKHHQTIVESLFTFLPEGVSVKNFHINEDGTINFSGSCLSFRVLKNFLDKLKAETDTTSLKIKEVKIHNLSYGLEKEYIFTASIAFYLGEN